ncbi:hypothetical protein [Streptomyces venezuelae]|uniref:hypothetical protein n=1 Tax=Streptomyces venezuelae TaxID=54571 RepID=UPI0037BBA714
MATSRIQPCRDIGKAVIAHVETDDALTSWLSTRCEAWGIEEELFKRRLAALIFVVCYALAADVAPRDIPQLPLSRIAEALEEQTVTELFSPIRKDPDYANILDVQEVWLISTKITAAQALYWGRLMHAAAEIVAKILAKE